MSGSFPRSEFKAAAMRKAIRFSDWANLFPVAPILRPPIRAVFEVDPQQGIIIEIAELMDYPGPDCGTQGLADAEC